MLDRFFDQFKSSETLIVMLVDVLIGFVIGMLTGRRNA